ncbi:GTP-binding protein [Metallumcola ferriviriculae]|uniref:GTP-binding protein n=1 Tax=Metallumcola ferriviriculae TaxID=3039180 RepID=A0AAU0URV4_9FIRM|nr:GTP-binding protein [Desulfitibacteraceae bacterium MK1]
MTNENMNIVIVGHVDHGKSTIIGRLLADTNTLPLGKLEQVREACRRNSKPFEYAFLLDALKDEQAQGITIDAARVFFKTIKRKYIIMDAPGHIEFLKNMVTGAARAEAALLVIDAHEGVMENSKRHGYLLSMLGIKQVVVLVNKMDVVDYNQKRYDKIVTEYKEFLLEIGVEAQSFIPVSGFMGDNVAVYSAKMPWYDSMTVLEKLDQLDNAQTPENQMFRMPVQGVFKFTAGGDDRRIVAGTIDAGKVKVGDEVAFYPSAKKSKVKSIERFNAAKMDEDSVASATGFTLEEQIYITRGELACIPIEAKPQVSTRIKTKLFWLGKEHLGSNRSYIIKIGTQKVSAELEKVMAVLDASTLVKTERQFVQRHEVAEVIFKLEKEVAFDKAENLIETSRFVLVDNFEISGGGIIVDSLPDEVEQKETAKNNNWRKAAVTREERAVKYAQEPLVVLISGKKNAGKRNLAKILERELFTEGKFVYHLNPDELVLNTQTTREECLKKIAKLSHLLMNAGCIVVAAVDDIVPKEMTILYAEINSDDMKLVWLGEIDDYNPAIDLHLDLSEARASAYQKVKNLLD